MYETGGIEVIPVGALEIRFRMTADQTGGAFTLFEFSVPPQARVPIPHFHEAYDETVYGLTGTLTWTVDGETVQVGPGDVLLIPRGAVHQFHNHGATEVAALSVVTPGILGPDYFREVGEALACAPPDMARIAAIMQKHGLRPVPTST